MTAIQVQRYVEIVKTPLGEGKIPYWVREAFIGLRLPIIERHFNGEWVVPIQVGIVGILEGKTVGECSRWFAYRQESLGILAKKNLKAASWLLTNSKNDSLLEFKLEEAMLVE
ncbi:MAG: hypothetical protein U1B79_01345 [Candidatus Pacearchaeota archaeon]|nr:hypothetical protein [Candidatus Pacearchaeota archaeon]